MMTIKIRKYMVSFRNLKCLAASSFLAMVLCLFPVEQASARNTSVYIMAKVKLDVRADNAVMAKKTALKDGPLQALKLIFKRLAPFRAYDRLPAMTLEDADDVIDSFAVRSEQNSSTRYLALLDYTFSSKRLQALLIKKGVPFFDRRSGKQVLMPVFMSPEVETTDRTDEKYWWRAWRAIDMKHALTDTRLYKAKKTDQDAWLQISSGNLEPYQGLRQRYAAQKLILVDAKVNPERDRLTLRLFGEDRVGQIDYTQELPVTQGIKEAYQTAAVIAFGILEGRWREPRIAGDVVSVSTGTNDQGSTDTDPRTASQQLVDRTVFLRVKFRGLRDWQSIKKRLQRIPGVQKMQINSLSPRGADVRLTYPGGVEQLQTQLSAYRFALAQSGKDFVLRSAAQ